VIADVLGQGVTVHPDGSTSFSWLGTAIWFLVPVLFLGAIFAYDPIMDFLHGGHDKRFPPKDDQDSGTPK
jgi:hypothetical protein